MAAAAYGSPFASNLTGGLLSDVMQGLVPGYSGGGLLDSNPQGAQPQPAKAAPAQGAQADASQAASQPSDADQIARLIARNRPSRLQALLHAWGTGQDFNTAQADLTERHIQARMLPAKIAADLQQAQANALVRGRVIQALAPPQSGAAPQGALDGSPGADVQTASAQVAPGVPTQAPRAAGAPPFDQNTLALMTLAGMPNADKAWSIMAPETEITRDGVIYNKKDPTGRIIGMAPHPQYINGQWVDQNSPSHPSFVPKYADGTMPDGKGGVIPIPGYAKAVADAAGATESAKQAAAAPYDMVTVNINGSPVTMSKAQFAALQGVNGVPVEAAPAGPAAVPASAPSAAPSPAQGGSHTITPQQAMQFYVAQGYKPEQAAGLVGNLIGESGLDASKTADDGSFGLAQWTGPRLQGLFAFAKRNKLDPSDPNTQLQYSHYELTNSEKPAGDAISNASNVGDATAAAVGYERPAGYTPQNPQGASGYARRLSEAQALAGSGGGGPAQPVQSAPAPKGVIAQGVNPETLATDQDALKALRNDVAEKRFLAGKANEFVQKQGDLATGPGYGIGIGPVNVKSISELIPGGHGTQLQDLDAITNQAWVHLRPQGSGSLRGPEIDSFKEAFPNTENLGPANVDISNRLNAEARQAEQELAFKEKWLQKNGTLTGADEAWAKLPIAHNATVGQGEGQPQLKARASAPKLPPRAPALPQRAAGAIDPRAVADLKRDPSPQARAEFDQVFGPGSAKRVLGGA